MDILETTDIKASAETLWTLLTDEAQVRRWNPDILSDEAITPGPLRPGLRSRMRIREGSRVVECESEITIVEPLRRLDLELRGGSLGANPLRLSYVLTPHGAGTRLAFHETWLPGGLLLRVLAPVLSWVGRRNTRTAMRRLRELAEG